MILTKKQLKELYKEPRFVRFNGSKYVSGLGNLVGFWNNERVYLK